MLYTIKVFKNVINNKILNCPPVLTLLIIKNLISPPAGTKRRRDTVRYVHFKILSLTHIG